MTDNISTGFRVEPKTYGDEGGTAVLAPLSDGLTMPSILLSIRKEPLDRLLVAVMFLALDNNLRNVSKIEYKLKYGTYTFLARWMS